VGVADSFPKLVTREILKPVFALPRLVHVICREGKLEDLLAQLAAHRLDIVLADEPASSSTNFKTFDHPLGECCTVFCAERTLAAKLKRGFPKSLHDAPALLPAENTPFRRTLETWFRARRLAPRVVAEFEDLALMKIMAAEGRGFIAVPSLAVRDAVEHYGFRVIAQAPDCRMRFHAITAERRIHHPAALAITDATLARSG
jgi:LysR family transcriptional regulator, transcriptional activator of nhaA